MANALQPIAERLREERIRRFKTISAMAEEVGVNRKSIESYEAGRTPINVAMLLVLKDYGFDIGYIVTGRRDDGELGFGDGELVRMFGLLSHREREAVFALLGHLSGQTVPLSDMGGSTRPTIHDSRREYRAPPEDTK